MNIRKAGPADAAVLTSIVRESFKDVAVRFSLTADNCPKHPSNCAMDWIEKEMARDVQYFLLLNDDAPIGCVAVEMPGKDVCYMERLCVHPSMRRQGFGQLLVRHAIEFAKSKGVSRMSIGIIAEQRELKNWYQRLGFVQAGTKRFPHLPFQVCFLEYQF